MKFPCQTTSGDSLTVEFDNNGVHVDACMGGDSALITLAPDDAVRLAEYLLELAEIHNG